MHQFLLPRGNKGNNLPVLFNVVLPPSPSPSWHKDASSNEYLSAFITLAAKFFHACLLPSVCKRAFQTSVLNLFYFPFMLLCPSITLELKLEAR